MGLFFVFNEAHNGYLEIAAQLGIVGIISLLIFLITTLLNGLSYWATIEKNTLYGVHSQSTFFGPWFYPTLPSHFTSSRA